MTTYLIDTWYIEYPDGRLEPCQNRATALYYVENMGAVRIVNPTRELLSK